MSDENDKSWSNMANDGFDQEFEFDTDGVDATKVGNETSMMIDKPGKYHVEVTSAKNYLETVDDKGNATSPHCLIIMTVLHSTPNQSPEGYRLIARAFIAGKGGGGREQWQTDSTMNLLIGAGLVKEQDGIFIDPETGSRKLNWKTWPQRLQGKQYVADVHVNRSKETNADGSPKYADRFELPFGRGLYQVDDPKVAGVPKNKLALQLIGKAPLEQKPANQPASQSAASQATSAASAPAAPAASASPAGSASQPPANPPPSKAGSADEFDDI